MHDARNIANILVRKAAEDGNTLTPMQLLKLVYIAHGWMLGLYGVPLIRNPIQAWKFGPVIPVLYYSIRQFRDNPVVGEIACEQNDPDLVLVETNLLEQIYAQYGGKSGIALSNLTHKEGSPWDRVFDEERYGVVIPNDIIQEHYAQLAE
ncbi:MAG: hypothetical protein COB93_00205 [Sneathiella sp.]|nr:MAG: hypothetical protein COB93_00205 [Sneathiella sp.]